MSRTESEPLELSADSVRALRRAAITAGGVYFPAFAVADGRRRRRVCGSDEDAVTMAIDAAERALAAWSGERDALDGLFLAVSHGPEVEGTLSQVVREALGLQAATRVVTFAADALSGISAVQAALSAVESRAIESALVVASEAADLPARNAGAAAVLVGPGDDGGPGARLTELARASALTHEHRRSSPDAPFEPDIRFLDHRYAGLASGLLASLSAAEFDAIVLAAGSSGVREQLRREHALSDSEVRGDFGAAGALLATVEASVHAPGQRVGLVVAGSGQIAVLALTTPADGTDRFEWHAPPAESRPPIARGEQGPALSLPVESPFYARSWGEMLRLEGAACTSCGRIAFPPSQRMICSGCGAHEWRTQALARSGTVLSQIENRFLPPGFASRVVYVLAELDDGCRYWAPMPAEIDGAEVVIGQRVTLRLRRFTIRDGVPVYSMKFVAGAS